MRTFCSANGRLRGRQRRRSRERLGDGRLRAARLSYSLQHFLRIFSDERRPPARLPSGLGAQPFAGRIGKRAARLGMKDFADRPAFQPMLVGDALVRLSDRRPKQARGLRLAPGHFVVSEGANEALDHFERVRRLLVRCRGPRNIARAEIAALLGDAQIRRHPVSIEEGREIGAVSRADAPGHEPAAIFCLANTRDAGDILGRMSAGQAIERRSSHNPRHEVEFGVLGDGFMDRTRNVLAKPGCLTFKESGEDADQKLLARYVVGMPDLRGNRREVVFVRRVWIIAAVHHHAAEREMHEVRSLEAAPRTIVAKRRHPRDDERGKAFGERLGRKAELLIESAAARIQEDVGSRQQSQHRCFPVARSRDRRRRSVCRGCRPKNRAIAPCRRCRLGMAR